MRKPIFAFLFLLVFQLTVLADTEGEMPSYTAETADKKFIFVMKNPVARSPWTDRYSQSGMYLNDGSETPLWTVDWFNSVFLPNDGKHIVRLGRWARYSAKYEEEVFSFFSEGKYLKTYETKDLIDFPWLLPHSSSHYMVILGGISKNDSTNDGATMKISQYEEFSINNGVEIDNQNNIFTVQTYHGDKFFFDLKTGNLISANRPARTTAITLFGALIIGYIAYVFLMSKMRLTKFALRIANFFAGVFLTFFLFLIPIVSVLRSQVIHDERYHYPGLWAYSYLSVSMLPRYLFTSLNLISQAKNNMLDVSYEAAFTWILVFWVPCMLVFALLTHRLISVIKSKRRNFFDFVR